MKLFPILLLFSIVCFGQTKASFDQRRDSIVQKGLDHYFQRDTMGLKEANKELQTMYIEHKDSLSLAKIYHFKALIHRIQYRLDSSYYYYHQSKNISILLKDSLEVGRRLLSMAYMQNGERDYIGAEITGIEGLRYVEPLNEIRYTGDLYNILGNVLTNLKAFEEARGYYKKAQEIFNKSKNRSFKDDWNLYILNNIGNTYLLERNPKKAKQYINKGLKYDSIKEKYPNQYQLLLGNLGDCNHVIAKKEESLQNYEEVLKFREEINNVFGLSLSHNGLAYYYQIEGKKAKALFHARKGYELAKQVNNNATRLSALLKLGALTSGNESKKYYQEYAKLNDSLNRRERYLKNQFAKVRYETEKKDKENKTLKQENIQKQQEAENERQQKIIFALLGVLGVVLIVVYSSNRRKKLMYEAQLQKASAREEERIDERNRISQELHDGILSRLFGVRIAMGFLSIQNDEGFKNKHEPLLEELQSIEKEIREVSHKLHDNFNQSNLDFLMIIDQLLVSKSSLGGFKYKLDTDQQIFWQHMDEFFMENIYRIVQESLQNIVKHAKAQKVVVSFSKRGKVLVFEIKDDGVGFVLEHPTEGIGIQNMLFRGKKLNGKVKILSKPNKGTTVRVEIPNFLSSRTK